MYKNHKPVTTGPLIYTEVAYTATLKTPLLIRPEACPCFSHSHLGYTSVIDPSSTDIDTDLLVDGLDSFLE